MGILSAIIERDISKLISSFQSHNTQPYVYAHLAENSFYKGKTFLLCWFFIVYFK